MKLRFDILYIVLIVLAANEFLNFGWWWHVQGSFNVADLGNLMAWIGLGVMLLRNRSQEIPIAGLSVLVIFYLLFVVVQIALATLYYDQSILKGVIGTRHQFYYASFFFFLLSLDTMEKIRTTLNMITILAILALILAIINYFGPTILTHKWAEGHRIRAGIIRSYIPGMPILSFAAVWEFSKWITKSQNDNRSAFWTFLLLAAHFFRQSRMRIIGVVSVIFIVLTIKRKFKLLILSIVIAVLGLVLSEFMLPENIVTTPFVTAVENVTETTGSWRGRLVQLKIDFEEFLKHPFIGSGATSLRVDLSSVKTQREAYLWALTYKTDLGYTHWLKAYGIVGMIWLILFFSLLWTNAWKTTHQVAEEDEDIALFLTGYVPFIIGTFVTLNHLMFANSIVLVCLLAAIIVRVNFIGRSAIQAENKSSKPALSR